MELTPSLSGDVIFEVSRVSLTETMSATTISAMASDGSFNDSAGGFLAAGFQIGKAVQVSGFTESGNNLYSGTITQVTTNKIIIGGSDGATIVDEAEGGSVEISLWESRRASVDRFFENPNFVGQIKEAIYPVSIVSNVAAIDPVNGGVQRLSLSDNLTDITFVTSTLTNELTSVDLIIEAGEYLPNSWPTGIVWGLGSTAPSTLFNVAMVRFWYDGITVRAQYIDRWGS